MNSGDAQCAAPRPVRPSRILVLAGAALLVGLLIPKTDPKTGTNDFAFYWTAARLVLQGGNPYSPTETVRLQNELSFAAKGPLVMLNPPWTLPLVTPFGLLSYSAAKSCWFVINLTLLLISIQWLWDLYGSGRDPRIGWLLAVTFLPVAVVLAIGQIGPFLLFGIAGFLYFQARQRWLLAGACLFLLSFKPHLVFLVWPALLLDAAYRRRWRAVVALGACLVAASLLAIVVDGAAFVQYMDLFTQHKVVFQETPTFGGLLRHVLGRPGMQSLPLILALLWFGAYWLRWRAEWNWQSRIPLLMLVSVAATSYAWFFDQVVLLPSVFQIAGLLSRSQGRRVWTAALAYLLTNGLILVLILTHRTGFWYSWTAISWLALGVTFQQIPSPLDAGHENR